MAHAGGRPTKYKEEYCDAIVQYFSVQPQQTTYRRTYYADGTINSEEPITLAEQIPTFQGFANDIGVHVDTLIEWAKIDKKFSEAYARAKQLQEKIWLINGMSGLYNSQFAQFFGKNCWGYKDKTETEHTGDVTISIKIEDE